MDRGRTIPCPSINFIFNFMQKFKQIVAIQDYTCHWFLLPPEIVTSFLSDRANREFVESGDFSDKYGEYWVDNLEAVALFIKDKDE